MTWMKMQMNWMMWIQTVHNKCKGVLHGLIKWFMNDCAVGAVLIIVGVLMGWITAPALYWLWKTLYGIL